ncbi:MAG: hypothetical protein SWX82_31225 [Cyanobacteriota bacterium]|nr:hypothetical protein [Cyanobacteriota bacterium]
MPETDEIAAEILQRLQTATEEMEGLMLLLEDEEDLEVLENDAK